MGCLFALTKSAEMGNTVAKDLFVNVVIAFGDNAGEQKLYKMIAIIYIHTVEYIR